MAEISPFAPHPVRYPVMLQRWQCLTFLHWRFEPEVVRALLPAELVADTFDGSAWVGLTPFLLSHLRAPFLPSPPWMGQFPEMNVRTYVRGPDGKPGVWFFTLEADRLLAVAGARTLYGLPYRWARMRIRDVRHAVEYQSDRMPSFGAGRARITVRPGRAIHAGSLENFLTARYRLYALAGKRLKYADIDHVPWPLQSAELLHFEQDVIEHSGVPSPQGKPLLYFARRLDVRIGAIRIFRSESTKQDSGSGS